MLVAAVLICGASALVGEAAARCLGLERGKGWSPAVGLSLLMAITLGAGKLPGYGTTAAVAALAVAALCLVSLLASGGIGLPSPAAVTLTVVAACAACLPFLSNGRHARGSASP